MSTTSETAASSSISDTLSVHERRLADWLARHRGTMMELLAEVVNIDSGSDDKAGVDAVGDRIVAFLAQHDIATAREKSAIRGDALVAVVGPERSNHPSFLLMGHRDTVFPKGEAARRPFTVRGQRAYGPGVADMKAGLVMNVFLLAAFRELGGLDSALTALITGDEEIGSPFSRAIIEREAAKADFVFNAEPGRISGNVVSERKGGTFLRFQIAGKAAHSGVDFASGISAIEELAHKVIALHAITQLDRGITINVGIVSGGRSVNMVAPNAEATIDVRYYTPTDRDEALARIRQVIATNKVQGAEASLEMTGEFLPLVGTSQSVAFLRCYQRAAQSLGFSVEGERTGGCADSGFAAGVGATVLCGLGPVGGKTHTSAEYLELDTLVPRTQATALTILRLAESFRQNDRQFS